MCLIAFHVQTNIADSSYKQLGLTHTQLLQSHPKFQKSYLPHCDTDLTSLLLLLLFTWDNDSIRCWLGRETYSSSRTLELAVVVLNTLLTGLFPIRRTSCCLEHTWLADSLHAWPQLSDQILHGWVGCPEPCGATVHLWTLTLDSPKNNLQSITLNTQSRCWNWYTLTPALSPLFPCWVNLPGIFVPKSVLLEEH